MRRSVPASSLALIACLCAADAGAQSASGTATAAVDAAALAQVDPELRAVLAQIPALTLDGSNVQAVRRAPPPPTLPPPAVQPLERYIEGGAGNPRLRVLIFDPAPERGGKPAVLHLHGGGYVVGVPEVVMPELQRLASALEVVVVSVDYRLAPEHPTPAGLDDAYAALGWLHRSADALGVDSARIALLGESAGAGLAAAVALRARDRGEHSIRLQVLRYPMLDDRTTLRSAPAHVGRYIWNEGSNAYGWTSVLGRTPTMDTAPAEAVPARVSDLRGLPPTWMGVGALDLFAQEDLAFAARLIEAGVPVELQVVPGAYHGFDIMSGQARVSREFSASWQAALRRALSKD
ncbi:alpha/beta hydrolase [Lysobacter sp. 5GHs7-4]|uniref:alpha/beta hydrolase n=1 Tax=Lysobacter sp. 5GHs7-4 TaxID=2904253 RepID=UPI001E59E1EF|nr:alpha/beta hydrolase [Lysobacter sp. 5GHs7-4]UHQ22303.1 alpha/beta hydrolase [Lysobacter sp. 5GHs7-4]